MRTIIGTALSLLLLSGCATTTKGYADYDASVGFDSYRTFAWMSEHPMIVGETAGRQVSPLIEGRIMNAIRDSLTRKGFEMAADREQADFVIAFTVGARNEIRVTSFPVAYRGYWGRGVWGAGYYGADVDVRQYTEGRLSIDIFDRREHRPVWHGWATKRITEEIQEDPEPVIREVVSAIMAKFPPA